MTEGVTKDVASSTKRRPRYVGAAVICGLTVVIGVVLVVVLSENVVYFRTVSEAVHDRKSQGSDRFRLAGAVVPGSRHDTDRGVNFEVTDGKQTVKVVHRGDPGQLFKDKAPVLCEGRWGRGLTFDSDRILIRHGAKYEPPKVNTKHAPKAKTASPLLPLRGGPFGPRSAGRAAAAKEQSRSALDSLIS